MRYVSRVLDQAFVMVYMIDGNVATRLEQSDDIPMSNLCYIACAVSISS